MSDQPEEIPTWPGYTVAQCNSGTWFATTQLKTATGTITLAVSAASRDPAVNGLHQDVRREQGVDLK